MFDIYEIHCVNTDTKYIGRSVELEKRWRAHKNMLKSNTHYNTRMQDDWNVYGEESFYFNVLENVSDKEEAIAIEQKYIDTTERKYNISNARDGGDTFSNNPRAAEISALKSRVFSGKGNPMYGRPKSQRMLDRVKEVNSKPVVAEGVEYASMTEAAKAHGVSVSTVGNRARSEKFTEWYYLDK